MKKICFFLSYNNIITVVGGGHCSVAFNVFTYLRLSSDRKPASDGVNKLSCRGKAKKKKEFRRGEDTDIYNYLLPCEVHIIINYNWSLSSVFGLYFYPSTAFQIVRNN